MCFCHVAVMKIFECKGMAKQCPIKIKKKKNIRQKKVVNYTMTVCYF